MDAPRDRSGRNVDRQARGDVEDGAGILVVN
jgi:hypothetical protein